VVRTFYEEDVEGRVKKGYGVIKLKGKSLY